MASVLIDYQIKGWAKKNERQIAGDYSDILYVGEQPSPASDNSDSVLASFCMANNCDLLTSDKRAYVPWLEQGASEVRISRFAAGGQSVYRVRI